MPDITEIPGCSFRPRCPRATSVCSEEPPLVEVAQDMKFAAGSMSDGRLVER